MKRFGWILFFCLIFSAFAALNLPSAGLAGQEFRSFEAIPKPSDAQAKETHLEKEGFQIVDQINPLSSEVAEKAVNEIFAAWNTPALASKLADTLPNRMRLLEAIQSGVPRHMKLKVLAIQNPRTVKQYIRPHPSGDGTYQVVSKLSVRVRCEIAASGVAFRDFQRLEGTSEYVISVTQKIR